LAVNVIFCHPKECTSHLVTDMRRNFFHHSRSILSVGIRTGPSAIRNAESKDYLSSIISEHAGCDVVHVRQR